MARKEQSLELVSFADVEMAHLQRQLAGSGHSIILTDRDGVLLSYYGDPSFNMRRRAPGWCRAACGASATAAPTDGHLPRRARRADRASRPAFPRAQHRAHVLRGSDLRSRRRARRRARRFGESDRAQQHTLVLVNLSAQAIEKRLFLHRFRDAFVVRFHSRPELLGTSSEGMIAFDPAGTIAAVDRNALFQLGCKQAAPDERCTARARVQHLAARAARTQPQKVVPPAADLRSAPRRPLFRPGAGARVGATLDACGAARRPRARGRGLERARRARSRRSGHGAQHPRGQARRLTGRTDLARRRDRHGQGALRARAACRERARRRAFRRGELRRDARSDAAERFAGPGGTLFLDEIGELPGACRCACSTCWSAARQ